MRSSGEYALMHANGMPFAELIKAIRDEQAQYLRADGEDLLIGDREVEDVYEYGFQFAVYTDRGTASE